MDKNDQVNHLGVIMDGNRRWATINGLPISEGHTKGCAVFSNLLKWCLKASIPHLSVYALSTENLNRREDEISHILNLVDSFFTDNYDFSINHGVSYSVIGNIDMLLSQTSKKLKKLMQ